MLPIHGENVVLEVQWLEQFGECTTNYKKLIMEFTCNGIVARIQGDTTPYMDNITLHQFTKQMQEATIISCFHLNTTTPDPPSSSE